MLDCYLCSDFKESDCFKDKEYKDTLRPYNDTHDSAVLLGGIINGTIISTPCKGHKNDVVKCETCHTRYDIRCKVCKLQILQPIYKSNKTIILVMKGCLYHMWNFYSASESDDHQRAPKRKVPEDRTCTSGPYTVRGIRLCSMYCRSL